MGASLALCLEMLMAKLQPEVAQGNRGLKLGLTEGARVTALPWSTGHTRLNCSHSLQAQGEGRVQLESQVEDNGGDKREGRHTPQKTSNTP